MAGGPGAFVSMFVLLQELGAPGPDFRTWETTNLNPSARGGGWLRVTGCRAGRRSIAIRSRLLPRCRSRSGGSWTTASLRAWQPIRVRPDFRCDDSEPTLGASEGRIPPVERKVDGVPARQCRGSCSPGCLKGRHPGHPAFVGELTDWHPSHPPAREPFLVISRVGSFLR